MGLLKSLLFWRRDAAHRRLRPRSKTVPEQVRHCQFEPMEPRTVMSASPLFVGATYLEDDGGSDIEGDRFEITFQGGAPETELTRIEISGDQGTPGFGADDLLFDTSDTGYGADHPFPFSIVSLNAKDPNASVSATVVDGGTLLRLDLKGIRSGDKLTFSIDVDEVEQLDTTSSDLAELNSGIDPITSGVEFQGSRLTAHFKAPQFFDAEATGTFRNVYDGLLRDKGLNLRSDDFEGKRDRSAGTAVELVQNPIPALISGFVFHDRNNNGIRENGEEGIPNVALRIEPINTVISSNSRIVETNGDGAYLFSDLVAGQYRIVEVQQPTSFVDGLDAAGQVNGVVRGSATNPGDTLEGIQLNGGDQGLNYNFGELRFASIQGRVQLADADGNCFGPIQLHPPLANVLISLRNDSGTVIRETRTDQDGNYVFDSLLPGTYSIREQTPQGLIQGGQHVGHVGNTDNGIATDDDQITSIQLRSGDKARDYNFCELAPASIAGFVYHDANRDGAFASTEAPIGNVEVALLGPQGQKIASSISGADGSYRFEGLPSGTYMIVEQQPAGWLDGLDTVGTIGTISELAARSGNLPGLSSPGQSSPGMAVNPGDKFDQIQLRWGDAGRNFNFGEVLSVSIAGRVHLATPAGDCFTPGVIHPPLAGVTIALFNEQGQRLDETQTNQQGEYSFVGLSPGNYRLVEQTPSNLIHGGQKVGSVGGSPVGRVAASDTLVDIVLESGQSALDYDFCEFEPASLEGNVFHDADNNGVRASTELPLANVLIQLRDANGNVVSETRTGEAGRYAFRDLSAGTYSLHETQPTGWIDGLDRAGRVANEPSGLATNPGDEIRSVSLRWGDRGTDFDFGELLPSSISGIVHLDPDRDCEPDPGELLLSNVRLDLLNERGEIVASTRTDSSGFYQFENLPPGGYTVRQHQPAEYFNGGQQAGSGGGQTSIDNEITFQVHSGDNLVHYNFCELPESKISGFVFQDGPPVMLSPSFLPKNRREIRDGIRTPDDVPLANVVLELRNGTTGELMDGSAALPGRYPVGPIRVRTDESGYYEFRYLPGGTNYSVFQVQPAGFEDSLDSVGTTSGFAFNPGDAVPLTILAELAVDPGDDAIVRIGLPVGRESANNNFSEIKTEFTPPPPESPEFFPFDVPDSPVVKGLDPKYAAASVLSPNVNRIPVYGAGEAYSFTWHLSVINAGMPRRHGAAGNAQLPASWSPWFVSFAAEAEQQFSVGIWSLGEKRGDPSSFDSVSLGLMGGRPIVGDFDGDGDDEIGIFHKGKWYIDVNGNGRWDEEDLLAQLGGENDQPVVGDWDGDGKDDIGIFGPIWQGDLRAIPAEPGIPDPYNTVTDRPKNKPPLPNESTDGVRILQRSNQGTPRADRIDHVFYFGRRNDIAVSGDWNGDGIASIGVFRDGLWKIDSDGDGRFSDRDEVFRYGEAGDSPVVGDFDGDGRDDIGVYRNGRWRFDSNSNRKVDAHDRVFELGTPDDLPVVGDWDGDGVDEPGTYRENPPNSPRQARAS